VSHNRNLYGIATDAATDERQSIGRYKQWTSRRAAGAARA
jgi:hypothetical protein